MGKVGLWIDYRKTIIVSVMETWEEIKKVIPASERHHKHPIELFPDDNYNSLQTSQAFSRKSFQEQINIYYDEVIANIYDASSILIFGSDNAKYELKFRLEINNLGDRIIGIETVDKMTDRQISVKILQQVAIFSRSDECLNPSQ